MNQLQFDALFTALYFALSASNKASGIDFRKGRSFFTEGYALIEFGDAYTLKLELADLVTYRDAGASRKQRLIEGLIGQARLALAAPRKRSEAATQDIQHANKS